MTNSRTGASAFASSKLDAFLHHHGIQTLLSAGFALHACVESTLLATHDLGYQSTPVSDALAAFTPAQKDHVMQHIVDHFGTHCLLPNPQPWLNETI